MHRMAKNSTALQGLVKLTVQSQCQRLLLSVLYNWSRILFGSEMFRGFMNIPIREPLQLGNVATDIGSLRIKALALQNRIKNPEIRLGIAAG